MINYILWGVIVFAGSLAITGALRPYLNHLSVSSRRAWWKPRKWRIDRYRFEDYTRFVIAMGQYRIVVTWEDNPDKQPPRNPIP